MAQLTNLVMLDLQPLQALGPEDEGAALLLLLPCTALCCSPLAALWQHSFAAPQCRVCPQMSASPLPLTACLAPATFPPACPAEAMAAAAAAWKVGSLSELRWCGDLAFEAGAAPVDLPRLAALEIE